VLYLFFVLEILPRKSAFADDVLVDSVRSLSEGILQTDHQLLSDDNRDSMSAVSSLSPGLSQANDDQANRDGSFLRNAVDDKLETARNMAADSGEEHRHLVAGDSFWAAGTETLYSDHQKLSVVENAVEHRPSVDRAVENIEEDYRLGHIVGDDGRHQAEYIDHRHDVVMEPEDEESHHIRHVGGDAADNHDMAPLPQPFTARSKTSELISYRDDFTEMSDDHRTHSAADSRLVK